MRPELTSAATPQRDTTMTILGYIAAPTGAGRHYSTHSSGGYFRGRRPRWYTQHAAAVAACKNIERDGWRDGGRGRDCYIVAVVRDDTGVVTVTAGGDETTGLHLCKDAALPLGCSIHVRDALVWLQSRPRRWQKEHGLI